jgi:hypothetical protein
MTEALNPEPLLRALHESGVRHIIIGGFAVNAHGVIRPSRDLDIVPDPDPDNLRRLAQLLADIDARHVGLYRRSCARTERGREPSGFSRRRAKIRRTAPVFKRPQRTAQKGRRRDICVHSVSTSDKSAGEEASPRARAGGVRCGRLFAPCLGSER